MSFGKLQHRVARAEQLLEGRRAQTRANWHTLSAAWREGWTPLRIVVAGMAAGFIAGRAEPLSAVSKIGGARWMQLIGTVSGMVASLQAAAAQAQAAAGPPESAEAAAEPPAPPQAPSAPPPAAEKPVAAPRPAEAATEISEH